MHRELKRLLPDAIGTSQWVVALNLDIREFSAMTGPVMESVQAALFLKTVYTKLINDFLSRADFYKPTGDGILAIVSHREEDLKSALEWSVETSIRMVKSFPRLCKDNPMINFAVPQKLGVGIAHGAASKLSSHQKTLDYSGKPLNLASRLMDYARPQGVVLDDARLLPTVLRRQLAEVDVYVRGLAETEPITVSYTRRFTEIPPSARIPLVQPTWVTMAPHSYTLNQMRGFGGNDTFWLPERPAGDQVDAKVTFPRVTSTGRQSSRFWEEDLSEGRYYELREDRGRWVVVTYPVEVAKLLSTRGVKGTWPVQVDVAYAAPPKPRPSRRTRSRLG